MHSPQTAFSADPSADLPASVPPDPPASVPPDTRTSPWFDYPIQVYPHHTDYAGIVWHGSYIRWMEEVRVLALAQVGVSFAELVSLGCDLPVVDLQIRYRQAMRMGSAGVLKARIQPRQGVRLVWEYELWSADGAVLHLTAQVTLVAIDRTSGKIMRRVPRMLVGAIAALSGFPRPSD